MPLILIEGGQDVARLTEYCGDMRFQFRITPTGTTANVLILDDENTGAADVAGRLISQWKFKPRLVDGVAVEDGHWAASMRFDCEGQQIRIIQYPCRLGADPLRRPFEPDPVCPEPERFEIR